VEYTKFVRKPFTVEATEITLENIGEVAEMIGTLREKDNGEPYIAVDRRLIPNLIRAYPGFWLTKMGDNVRCYAKRVFKQQFVALTPDIENWINYFEGNQSDEQIEDDFDPEDEEAMVE
jgi:hypothetical protein